MPRRRRDLELPLPLRRIRRDCFIALGLGVTLVVATWIASWAYFGFRKAGPLTPAAMLPFFLFGIGGSYLVERRRRTLVERLRDTQWRLCTVCAYPLETDTTRCPECGLEITAHEAAAAWLRCPWAQ